MSLDGLRAWIGVVERKLTMRTRVFLVLVAIAIGGAGAGIYLALDARDDAVSESELQSVRDELAEETGETDGESVAGLETQVRNLQAEVAELKSDIDSGADGDSASPGEGAKSGADAGGAAAPETEEQPEALTEKTQEDAEK